MRFVASSYINDLSMYYEATERHYSVQHLSYSQIEMRRMHPVCGVVLCDADDENDLADGDGGGKPHQNAPFREMDSIAILPEEPAGLPRALVSSSSRDCAVHRKRVFGG